MHTPPTPPPSPALTPATLAKVPAPTVRTKVVRAKRDPARAARIRSLVEDGGMSLAEARACEGLVCA